MAFSNAAASTCSSSLAQENLGAAPERPHHIIVNISPLNRPNQQTRVPAFDVELFEAHIRSAKQSALLVAALQSLSRFFGFCALTWATVVLLGGFASALRLLDFYLITALLLLEALRLFAVQFFYKLLSRAFFREERLSKNFTFTDRQPFNALLLVFLDQGLNLILAAASLISCILRLFLSGRDPLSQENPLQDDGPSKAPTSLYAFYALVILNSSFAVTSSLLRPFLRQRCHGYSVFSLFACFDLHESNSAQASIKQNSLMCFHDEVYKTAMEAGLPEADQLDILDFAFTKLANDIKRNIRPPLIKQLNRDMIRYMYHGQHGIAMVGEYLKSGDVWKQVVAASMPGFWAEETRIGLQVALFWMLRERMYGGGKDAEAALHSIKHLGQAWAKDASSHRREYPFLINDPATASNVVDTLVSLIVAPIRPSLLFQVGAFEACCRHPKVLAYFHREGDESGDTAAICAALQDLIVAKEAARGRREDWSQIRPEWQSKLRVLCCRLHSIVAGRRTARRKWMPTRMYASSALLNLVSNGRKEALGPPFRACIARALETDVLNDPAAATAADGSYFWMEDMKVVEKVRCMLGLEVYHNWGAVRLVQPNGKELSDIKAIYAIVDEARHSL